MAEKPNKKCAGCGSVCLLVTDPLPWWVCLACNTEERAWEHMVIECHGYTMTVAPRQDTVNG